MFGATKLENLASPLWKTLWCIYLFGTARGLISRVEIHNYWFSFEVGEAHILPILIFQHKIRWLWTFIHLSSNIYYTHTHKGREIWWVVRTKLRRYMLNTFRKWMKSKMYHLSHFGGFLKRPENIIMSKVTCWKKVHTNHTYEDDFKDYY